MEEEITIRRGEYAQDSVQSAPTYPPKLVNNSAAVLETDFQHEAHTDTGRWSSARFDATDGDSTLALPPVDRGRGANIFLATAFLLELVLWGYVGAFGVIQLYLSTHAPFDKASLASIGAVGTVANGLYFVLPFPLVVWSRRYPHRVTAAVWVALGVNVAATVGASFATSVPVLILLQGVIAGVSGSVLYLPAIIYLPEWFIRRRGTASGLIYAATGLGGAVFPYVISALLEHVGFAWTTRIWAFITLVTLGPSIYFIRPRLPVVKPAPDTPHAPVDMSFLWDRTTGPLFACVFLAGLSWYPVATLIPTYVSATGASVTSSNVVLSLLNISNTIAGLVYGWLSDRFGYAWLFLAIGAGEAVLAAASWSTATSMSTIVAFVCLFGAFNGQTATWNAAARDLSHKNPGNVNVVFSGMSVARGVACICGPLISNSLYAKDGGLSFGHFGFGAVMMWVTATAAASGLAGMLLGLVQPSARKSQQRP